MFSKCLYAVFCFENKRIHQTSQVVRAVFSGVEIQMNYLDGEVLFLRSVFTYFQRDIPLAK